ncbi:MAG: hypothetical protein A3F41_06350 [Coxiella sp. RIFCSPHIGHO2_12_FULL_44_14]|nr:MAG: hypothetical protein A3F41_06350 [Coxiella sp. RIFCSPHIGHO2_12_FULL_44_14]
MLFVRKRDSHIVKYHIYAWQGMSKYGKRVRGKIPAENIAAAESELISQEIDIISLKERQELFPLGGLRKRIKAYDVMLFFRQMGTMTKAGIPLVQAMEILSAGLENVNMTELVITLHRDVSSGDTFSEALKKHPRHFSYLVCSLIEVGEQSGTLDVVLEQIAEYLEKIHMLKGRIKKAMFYPIAVLCVTLVVSILLLTFIVPRFQDLFGAFGADLPAPTQVVIHLSAALQNYWWLIVGITTAVIVSFMMGRRHSKRFRHFLAMSSLRIFIFGPLFKKTAIARITRTLAISLAAGIPLVTALDCVARVAGNIIYTEAILQIRDEVTTGTQLYQAMRASKLFPMMALQMIGIGEKAGELEEMLTKVADFYEEQVDIAVDGLSTLIEPVMLVILGLVVGGFVVSMYLPIFKLGTIL